MPQWSMTAVILENRVPNEILNLSSCKLLILSALVASSTQLCDGAQVAIFGDFLCVLYFQRAASRTFQTCILNSH